MDQGPLLKSVEQVQMHLESSVSSVPVIGMGAGFSNRTDFVRVGLDAGTAEMMPHPAGLGDRRMARDTAQRHQSGSEMCLTAWRFLQHQLQQPNGKPSAPG